MMAHWCQMIIYIEWFLSVLVFFVLFLFFHRFLSDILSILLFQIVAVF